MRTRRPQNAVLVIEDEAMVREVLSTCFILLDFSVDSVDRIEGAMALLEARSYDVIIVDRVMPGVGGADGVAKIRKLLAGRPCFIIGISGNASAGIVENWKQSGIDVFAEKPLEFHKLRRLVESWREGRMLEAEPVSGGEQMPVVLDASVRSEIEALGRRTGRELFGAMWAGLIESLPGHLARIDEALGEGDARKIADAAHGLRGLARAIGASELASSCGALEDESTLSDAARRKALRVALGGAVERVRAKCVT